MNDAAKKIETVDKFTALTSLADVRDLKPHPIANADPLMNADEFIALKVSIKEIGIREPITLIRDDGGLRILDGRNRYRAAGEVGHRFASENFRIFTGSLDDARKLAGDLNDIRRHLTADDRKEKAARLIRENPGLSSRAIAAKCGVSHTLIAEMRKEAADERSKDERLFDKFVDSWIKLPISVQDKFVKEYRTELSELMR
jgi:ParB-like chromosome segregation protein Spo0J